MLNLISYLFLFSQQDNNTQRQQEQLMQLARNYERNARYEQALEIYQRLLQDEPGSINFYRGVLNMQIKLNNLAGAETVVKTMLETNSSEIVEVDLADIYYKMGAEEKAFSVWNGIVDKYPQKQVVYQIVAASLIRNSLYDEAIEIYQKGQKELGSKDVFIIEIANLYRAQLNYRQAVQLYLDYLEKFPNQYDFIEHNITSLTTDAEINGEIEKIILERIYKNKGKLELRNVLAAFYIRSSNYRAALDEYSSIDQYIKSRPEREKEKLGRELFRFAQDAFNDGVYEYAIQAFQLVIDRYPNSAFVPEAKIGIGHCLEQRGDYLQAVEKYNEVVQAFPKTSYAKICAFRIGEIQLEKLSDAKAAEKSFREVLGTPPFNIQNYESIFRIGDCYVQRGFLEKALSWYDQILHQKSIENNLRMKALLKIGKIYYWQGDFERATENFNKIKSDPINITNDREGFYVNDALENQMLIDEGKAQPELLKKFASAELLIEQKNYNEAKKLLDDIIAAGESNPLIDNALIKIGELSILTKNYNEAIATLQNVVQQHGTSYFVDFAQKSIGDIYYQRFNDSTRALQAYELVLTNYPDSIYLEEVRNKIRLLEKN